MNNPTRDHLSTALDNYVTVVSGLPRSGTSMMMKILEAGGMAVLVDNIRSPDQDNPKGYYEYELVKTLSDGNNLWLSEAVGKVVKIIAALLQYLPDTYNYRIVFMHRPLSEILASQLVMVSNRGINPDEININLMTEIYQKHLIQVDDWVAKHSNVQKIDINHHDMIYDPLPQITRINHFFGGKLNMECMQNAIDPSLYRQRKPMS